jgi:steroid 5-alpha reductase family enzyme
MFQHPNYFGDITQFTGLYLISFASLEGPAHIAILSPIFVAYILMFLSGIPMLNKLAEKRWKGNLQWEDYQRRTSLLIPMFPK